jgi:hypothetical protein
VLVAGVAALAAAAWGVGRAGKGPEPAPHGTFAFGGVTTSPSCDWGRARWVELDKAPVNAMERNGELGGQGLADVGGRVAWKITSDWGQLVLPLGVAEKGDPFAVEAEFFIPPVTGWMRGADITVFTDAVGGKATGEMQGGIQFSIRLDPGKPTYFEWALPRGSQKTVREYVGMLTEDLTGRWHTMRIEGSRSAKWFRGILDGRLLVAAHGDYDLSGTQVVLGAGYAYLHPIDVAWSNLRTFVGTPECR